MTDQDGSGNGQPGDWIAGIGDEGLRGYVQQKGFKDPGALADSYRNLEKLQGVPADRLLRLPDKPDAPEWEGVYSRLGRPGKPEEYGLTGDEALLKRMLPTMHKNGVTKTQAEALAGEWEGYVKDAIAEDVRVRAEKDAAEITALRSTWGGDYEKNAELGRRAGREFGLSQDEFNSISGALGSAKTLELFQRIGSKLGEAPPLGGDGGGGGGGFGMTKDQAQARINSLTTDKDWTARYLAGGKIEAEEMGRLSKIVSGG